MTNIEKRIELKIGETKKEEISKEKPEQKRVNMAILFEKIKESPKGILLKDLPRESKFSRETVFRYLKELKEKELIKIGDFGKTRTVFEAEKFPGTLSEIILGILRKEQKTSLKELTQEISELLERKVDKTTVSRRVRELTKEGKLGVKERAKGGRTMIFLPEKKTEVFSYSEMVLNYVKENPGNYIREIAKKLEGSHSNISRIVQKLIKEGELVPVPIKNKIELYDKKFFLEKYGIMPTEERLRNWGIKEIDDYLREKYLDSEEIKKSLKRIAFAEDDRSLAVLKRLNEIAPKDLEDKFKKIEKEVEEIKKVKPEAKRILEVIGKIKKYD